MESFQKGDRVSLKEPLGPLKAGEMGLVVEVYSDAIMEIVGAEVAGSKDFFMPRGEFDYDVVFPRLRGYVTDYSNGAWLPEDIDLSQFHSGDVIPMGHDELNFIDSELREVMQ
jgi:hypothetical protein